MMEMSSPQSRESLRTMTALKGTFEKGRASGEEGVGGRMVNGISVGSSVRKGQMEERERRMSSGV
jgi:hypothetical protein